MIATKTEPQNCLECGYRTNAATEAFGEHTPKAGDYSMCLNCGAIAVFDEELRYRQPTPLEKARIDADAQVIHAQLARAYVVNEDLRNKQYEQRID